MVKNCTPSNYISCKFEYVRDPLQTCQGPTETDCWIFLVGTGDYVTGRLAASENQAIQRIKLKLSWCQDNMTGSFLRGYKLQIKWIMFTISSVGKTIHQYKSNTWSINCSSIGWAVVEYQPKYQWIVERYFILTWLTLFWLILNWNATNRQSIYRQSVDRYLSHTQVAVKTVEWYLTHTWSTFDRCTWLTLCWYVGHVSAKGQPILGRHIGRVSGQRISW